MTGDDTWEGRMRTVRALLLSTAAAGCTVTYDEVRDLLGNGVPHRGEGDLASLLRAASEAEEADGVGLISAVVVGRSGLPGPGWFRLAAEHGRDVGDRRAAWEAERNRLRARVNRDR